MSIYIHPSSIVDEGVTIGGGTKIWHFCHIMSGAYIGEECSIGQNVVISPDVRLGDRCRVQNNVSLYTGVICEEEVFLGPSCVFTNVVNPRAAVSRKHEFRTTLVKRGATIGANATIVCGRTIGRYAFVGAGSVVTHDIPDYALVVGNPARQIGWMSEVGERLYFDASGFARCPSSKQQYRLLNGCVSRLDE